jgi:hypothetical protein
VEFKVVWGSGRPAPGCAAFGPTAFAPPRQLFTLPSPARSRPGLGTALEVACLLACCMGLRQWSPSTHAPFPPPFPPRTPAFPPPGSPTNFRVLRTRAWRGPDRGAPRPHPPLTPPHARRMCQLRKPRVVCRRPPNAPPGPGDPSPSNAVPPPDAASRRAQRSWKGYEHDAELQVAAKSQAHCKWVLSRACDGLTGDPSPRGGGAARLLCLPDCAASRLRRRAHVRPSARGLVCVAQRVCACVRRPFAGTAWSLHGDLVVVGGGWRAHT